jgi:hypothetical protein
MTSAVYDVGLLDDWSWLQDRRNADAWTGNTAILNNRRRLYKVQYRPEAGSPYLDVKYITPADFDRQTHLAYSTIGNYPLYYTTGPELSVILNPYPTTEDERVKLWFTAVDTVVPPTNNNDTFPVPEIYKQLRCSTTSMKSWHNAFVILNARTRLGYSICTGGVDND